MAANEEALMWVEKYRPKILDEVVGLTDIKESLKAFMRNPKTMPHLMFAGIPGTGKTTIALSIAQNSKGDVRSAINDLQSLSEENHTLTLQDTMMLSSRNKDISMDDTLKAFFTVPSIAEASRLLSYSSVDYDDFLLSVSDNLPKRYTDPAELAKAFDFVSQADVFRGRIGIENWHLLRYFFNELARASAVNPQSYKPF